MPQKKKMDENRIIKFIQHIEKNLYTSANISINELDETRETIRYVTLLESVTFEGTKLRIIPKLPFLRVFSITKFLGATEEDNVRFEKIPFATPSEYDLVSIGYEPHTDKLICTCVAATGDIIKLSERIIDEESIVQWEREAEG